MVTGASSSSHPRNAPHDVAVVVPIKAFDLAKTRLADALDVSERAALARQMAQTVLAAANGLPTYVVADNAEVIEWAQQHGARVIRPDRPGLNYAVTFAVAHLARRGTGRVIVAHGDLPLARDFSPLVHPTTDVAIVTDRHGFGTNVLSLPTDPRFVFSYGEQSAPRHKAEAQRLDYTVTILDDERLGWDVDTPEDLATLPPTPNSTLPISATTLPPMDTTPSPPSPRPFAVVSDLEAITLVGDQWGDPTHQPVILMHGGGQNRFAWKHTAARLATAGYFVTSIDARGHGDSQWSPNGFYDMRDQAYDLHSILRQFDQKPVVVGASMGGMTALFAQGHQSEQLYAAVVLVDVTPTLDLDGVARIVRFMSAHPDGFASLDEAADAIADYNPHRERQTNPDGLAKVLRQQGDRWHWRWDPRFITSKPGANEEDHASFTRRMHEMADDLNRNAARLTVPTLLVRGAQSDLVTVEAVKSFLTMVPHAEFVDVSGTGHMVAGDDNDAFTAAVEAFLQRHLPPTPSTRGGTVAADTAANGSDEVDR